MEQGAAPSRAHILAIPYPLVGHMIPMIQVCKLLIAIGGCRVTMVSTERDLASLLKLLPKDYQKHHISAISIPDGLPFDLGAPDWDIGRTRIHAQHEPDGGMARSFELLVPNFHDVACVISDLHLRWTQEAASRLGVPRIALWVSAAAALHVFTEAKELIKSKRLPFKAPKGQKYEEKGVCNMIPKRIGRPPVYHVVDLEDGSCNEEKISLPGLPPLYRRDFPTFLQIEDSFDIYFHTWIDNARSCYEASMVIINSFDALERTIMALLKSSGMLAHAIGPLSLLEDVVLMNQPNDQKHKNKNDDHENSGLLSVVETLKVNECLSWLDKQNAWSVLYVAFGTTVELTKAQAYAIALGLKASQQPFIWVLPHYKEEELPKDFLENIEHKGFLLNWAPQNQILQQFSIGAFLTHCGWNSTMEAICSGVPLLCLPFFNDQTLQCHLLVEVWKIALRLERSFDDGIALANNVSFLTQEVLLKETGSLLRKRAQELMIAAKNSVQDGGSSRLTLDAILKLIN